MNNIRVHEHDRYCDTGLAPPTLQTHVGAALRDHLRVRLRRSGERLPDLRLPGARSAQRASGTPLPH